MKLIKIVFLIFVSIFLLNCGYHLAGTSSSIPKEVKTVYIPDFKNLTVKFSVDKLISKAIREEFILRTKLDLLSTQVKADSVIEGVIETFKTTAISYSDQGEGNQYEIKISISLKFINLLNSSIIYEGEKMKFEDTFKIDYGDADGFENEAMLKIARKFASDVVSKIFLGI